MIGGIAILLAILLTGEAIAALGVPMPGSVIGMLILATSLSTGIVKKRWIEGTATFLLRNMALFFVPAGVGLMAHVSIFRAHWGAISFAVLVSFLLVLLLSALLQRAFSGGPRGGTIPADTGEKTRDVH